VSPFAPARQRWQVDCCSCHMICSQVLPSCVSVCSRYRVSISLKHGNIRVFSRTINACMLVPPHPPWRLKLIKPVGHDFSVRGEASHDLYMWRGGEQLLYEWIPPLHLMYESSILLMGSRWRRVAPRISELLSTLCVCAHILCSNIHGAAHIFSPPLSPTFT